MLTVKGTLSLPSAPSSRMRFVGESVRRVVSSVRAFLADIQRHVHRPHRATTRSRHVRQGRQRTVQSGRQALRRQDYVRCHCPSPRPLTAADSSARSRSRAVHKYQEAAKTEIRVLERLVRADQHNLKCASSQGHRARTATDILGPAGNASRSSRTSTFTATPASSHPCSRPPSSTSSRRTVTSLSR